MFGKRFVIFFTILMSAQLYAMVSQHDSWTKLEEDKKRGKIAFEIPQYNLSSGFFLKATEVCLSGPEKAVIEPIKIKFRMKCIRRHGDKCQREIKVYPSKNIKGSRYGCMVRKDESDPRSSCLMWGMVPYEVQTSFQIPVVGIEGEAIVPLFEKELSLPACKDVD